MTRVLAKSRKNKSAKTAKKSSDRPLAKSRRSSKESSNGHAENGVVAEVITADSEADEVEEPEAEESQGSGRRRKRATAQSMAAAQRDISVSEFFAKNRHLLGFDNPRKALLTTVKEAVDNSLDACEEAGIVPELWIHIEQTAENRFKIGVQDNGPGIVKKQIPLIFGKLLYGSKFHRMRMSKASALAPPACMAYSQPVNQ